VLKENRDEAIAIINAAVPETPERAYHRGQKDGYAAGVRDTLEEKKAQPPVESKLTAPTLTTPDQEMEKFERWIAQKSEYYKWETECLEALRATLVEGDRIQPIFAYSCIIIGADGREREFKRVPNKKR
jgi:hypothetical protein